MSLIIPANTLASGGFAVDNSCRFNSGSTDYLNRTFSTGNRKTFTSSTWIKRSSSSEQDILSAYNVDDTTRPDEIRFQNDGRLYVSFRNTNDGIVSTVRLFRDVSAWYHIVVAVDTTQGTTSNRVKIYINGVQETSLSGDGVDSSSVYPSLNFDCGGFNRNNNHQIGARAIASPTGYWNGYMSETVFIDGQQLDPTSFGEFDEDSGIWKPIDVSGLTFGTNGFYLDFENSGSLGADVSGNGNNFTVNNLTAIDQTTDTPTNNFATLNALLHVRSGSNGGVVNLSDGNVTMESSAVDWKASQTNFAVSSGKWYCELKFRVTGSGLVYAGIWDINQFAIDTNTIQDMTNGISYYLHTGETKIEGVTASYGNSLTAGDILGIALDLDNNYIYFAKNGTWQNSGDPTSGASGTGAKSVTANKTYAFGSSNYGTPSSSHSWNFGNPPFTISSGNTDGNGYGNFEYAVPSGYLSLCTKNLSEVLG